MQTVAMPVVPASALQVAVSHSAAACVTDKSGGSATIAVAVFHSAALSSPTNFFQFRGKELHSFY
jgi:hypothetical protein